MNKRDIYSGMDKERLIDILLGMDEENRALRLENERLAELVRLRAKELYARKAESLAGPNGTQLSLFDDIELNESIAREEEKEEERKEQKAGKRHAGKKDRRSLINLEGLGLPVEETTVDVTLPPAGARPVGYEVVDRLAVHPSRWYIKRIRYQKVAVDREDGTTEIISARPKGDGDRAMAGSMLDPSAAAHVIASKTAMALPLYRQEQELRREGIPLSRQTMSSACFQADSAIAPLADLIRDRVIGSDVTLGDETPLNVIELNGLKAQAGGGSARSYVWGFSTGRGGPRAVWYMLGPTRKYEVASDFLGEGRRYLQSDGYGAYFGLRNVTNVPCYAHMRRKFFDAAKAGRPGQATESSKIVAMFDAMFAEDRRIEASARSEKGSREFYEEIRKERERSLRPMAEALFAELHSAERTAVPKSSLGTALRYSLGLEECAFNVFLDGRLELTNNFSEREAMKPFVTGRKNWLFANTQCGAEVTCDLFSVVRTAIENGLRPEAYLEYLLESLPKRNSGTFPYADYLPWSDRLPERLRAKKD